MAGFNCMRCWRPATVKGRGGRRLCQDCLDAEIEDEQRRLLAPEVGGCAECGRAFMVMRAWHVYCSASCRYRAWRRQQRTASTA